MAAKRSTQMTIIGVSVFIIGAGLVFLGLHGKKASPQAGPAPAPTQSAPVGTTVHAAGAGTTGVPIVIPDGYTAVSVSLDRVPGLSGHAVPGDFINLYATVKSGNPQKGLTPPFASSRSWLSRTRRDSFFKVSLIFFASTLDISAPFPRGSSPL